MGQRSEVTASLGCLCMWRLDSNFVAVTGESHWAAASDRCFLLAKLLPVWDFRRLSKQGSQAERQPEGQTNRPLTYRGRRQTKADGKRRDFLSS